MRLTSMFTYYPVGIQMIPATSWFCQEGATLGNEHAHVMEQER